MENNDKELKEETKSCDKATCPHQDSKCNKKEQEHKKNNKHHDKLKEEIHKLTAEIEKLKQDNQELQSKVQLTQAEMINYRKRKEEETASRLKYANQDLISELILVLDNFERAIKLDDNDLTDELSKFLTGFKMMYANLDDILKKYGVVEIECLDKEFDPNLMQALMIDHDPNFKDDEVIEVLLKGYKLKDRVIRPASVKVNKLENDNEGEDNNE